MRVRMIASVLIAVAAAAGPAAGATGGDIAGRVGDGTGAVLPGVLVTARNAATGLLRTTVTLQSGEYRLASLEPGAYDVAFELQGFAARSVPGVVVDVGQILRIDVTLTPQLAETVTVGVRVPSIDVADSKIRLVVDQTAIGNLPLNSRNVVELGLLSGATASAGGASVVPFSPLNFGAQNNRTVRVLLDGVDLSNDFSGGVVLNAVPQAAVEQFEVITGLFKAEHGETTGGVISLVSKSGTNLRRSDAFFLFRNRALNARNAFETVKPPFRREQFGAAVGGPLVVDRAHFFGALERNQENASVTVNTGGAFPAVEGTFPNPRRDTNLLGTVRQQLRPSQWLNLVGTMQDRRRDEFYGGRIARSGGARVDERLASLGGTWYAAPLTTVLVGVHGSFTGWRASTHLFGDGPRLIYPSAEMGWWPGGQNDLSEDRFRVKGDLTWTRSAGRTQHVMKVGVGVSRVRSGFLNRDFPGPGIFVFPADSIPVPLLAIVNAGSRNARDIVNDKIAAYLQDDWTLGGLTLNAGIRYDLETNPANQNFASQKTDPQLPYVVRRDRAIDANNVAPRLGFAWDLGRRGVAVLRGGYGVYYGRLLATYPTGEIQSDTQRVYTVFLPGTTDRDRIPLEGRPYQLNWLLPREMPTPFAHQVAIGFASQLPRGLAAEIDYSRSRGRREVYLRHNINPLDARTFSRPLPQYQDVYVARTDGSSSYDALQVTLKRRFAGRHQFRIAYTLSRAENDFDEPLFASPGRFGRAPAAWDERHRAILEGLLVAPWGLQVSGIARFSSARPFTVFTGQDGNFNGDLTDDQPPGVGRNSERSQPYANVDLRISRSTRLRGAVFTPMLEAFNLLNRPNYDPTSYIGNLRSPIFGRPTAALPPRQIQIGVRLAF